MSRQHVAEAAGSNLEEIIGFNSEAKAMNKMAEGTSKIVAELYSRNGLDGVLALGGTMGTSLALTVMGTLPIGLPKLILSTIAFSPLIPVEAIRGDLMMMQWVAGLRGINSINRKVLDTAAGAIAGAAEAFDKKSILKNKIVIGITAMGSTPCKYIGWLQPALERRGYELAVFHATGMGGRMFERAIEDGLIDVAMDLELTELANELCGGVTSAGKHRLEAAGKIGIPQIVAPTVNAIMLATNRPMPRRFRNRPTRQHNWLCANVPTSKKEKTTLGRLIARKLNKATGPTAVIIPMKGRYPEDTKMSRGIVDDAEGMLAVRDALKANLKSEIKVVEVEAAINERAYTDKVLDLLDEMMQK